MPSRLNNSFAPPGPPATHNQFSLQVTYRPITELKLDPRSPRQHTARHIQQVEASIRTFGFLVPILIGDDGMIMAGHARFLAAQRLDCAKVPTIAVSHLTAEQRRAYQIADNRLTEISSWDEKLLAETLRDLSLLDLDFSLDVTGFDLPEIDVRIESLSLTSAGEPNAADDMPSPADGPPITLPGDLWLLGQHRLLCGSALEASSFDVLMDTRQASMVFTDPPYNVRIEGNVSGLGVVKHRDFAMATGEMNKAEFTAFLSKALGLAAVHSKDGSLHYVCMDWRHLREVMTAGDAVYTEMKNMCVWVKDNAGMGSFYRSQHELVLVYKKGKGQHRNNVELGRHGRNRSNIWRYPGINSFSRKTEEGNLLALHPTVKPVNLVADAILDCTTRRDIVLDPFVGSGSTLMAAERVGRRCYGIELDPVYVDTAVRRWQAVTGGHARRAADNRPFDFCSRSVGGAVAVDVPADADSEESLENDNVFK